ncbi:MAG: response regulator [Bacteroidota bacterium]|jgi:DNA-binding NarL/FixJ family response regulator
MSRKKLFIIEDDPMFAEMLKDHLTAQRPAWELVHFSTGEEAVKNAFMEPTVAIIDYHLDLNNAGGMSGIDTMTEIRKASKNTQCVFLSGQKSYGLALQTISHGANNYVLKDDAAFAEITRILDSVK